MEETKLEVSKSKFHITKTLGKATKFVWYLLFIGIYSLLFIGKLYESTNTLQTQTQRIILPTAMLIIPCVFSFVPIKKEKMPSLLCFVISTAFSVFVILENFWMLQFMQEHPVHNINPDILWLNILIYFALYFLFFGISSNFKFAVFGTTLVTLVLGMTEFYLVRFRGIGFLAVDLLNVKTALNVAGGYSYMPNYRCYLLLMNSMALCTVAFHLKSSHFFRKWKRILPLLVGGALAFYTYQTLIVSDVYDEVIKIKYFKPQESIHQNGMPLTFVKSIKDLIVKEPEGYSLEAVKEIANQYQGQTASDAKNKPNVIAIMDEAFTDFSSICDLKISKDPIPFIHSLSKNTVKGQMYTSVFGGGTASTEFEFLTADSMAFVPNGITAYSAYINDKMPNLTTILQKLSYGGMIAMHPYKGNGYSRNKVYPLLGFERFLTIDDFSKDTTQFYGKFISDPADVNRILSEYEAHKKKSDKPFYLFNVTMQNHSPFLSKDVDNSIQLKYEKTFPQAQNYMNLLRSTDQAVENLIKYFQKQKEPTVVVFFGDHEPKLEDDFYTQVKKSYSQGKSYKYLKKNNTQFFIWANYNIEEKKEVHLSANYLSNELLDITGISKSGYQQFLSDVRKQIPVITKKGYVAADGNWYELGDKDSPYYAWIKKYNIIQYNHLFDTKHRLDSFFEVKQMIGKNIKKQRGDCFVDFFAQKIIVCKKFLPEMKVRRQELQYDRIYKKI